MSQYITAEEAVKLSKQSTATDLVDAKGIYDLYLQSRAQEHDQEWLSAVAIATIFNAGRVAGIRQERAKRHHAAQR